MNFSLSKLIFPPRWRPRAYLYRKTLEMCHGCVHSGAFAGMKYIDKSYCSCFIPKILGIYERELGPAVESACATDPDVVVDIGAAEGYYAVGLCRRLPNAKVVAFEMCEEAQALLRRMIDLNACADRIEVRGKCEIGDLRRVLSEARRPLVVSDCEGYENVLMDPAAVPELKKAMLIIELHDVFEPGTAERLLERFRNSHEMERIWAVDRSLSEYPFHFLYLSLLPRSYIAWALSEWRPGHMSWLVLRPRV